MASTENGPTQVQPITPVGSGQRDDGGGTEMAEHVPHCRAYSSFDGDRVTAPGTPATLGRSCAG